MSTTKTKRAGKAVADASRKQRATARDEAKARKLAQEMGKTPAGKKMKIGVSVNGSDLQSADDKALQDHRDIVLLKALEVLCTEEVCTVSLLQRRLHVGYTAATNIIDRLIADHYAEKVESGGCRATAETMKNWNEAGEEVGVADTRTTVKFAGGPAVPLEQVQAVVADKPSTPGAQAIRNGLRDVVGPGTALEPKSSGLEAFARKLIDDEIKLEEEIDARFPRGSVTLSIPTDIGKVAAENGGGRFAIGDVAVVSQPSNDRSFLLATNGWMLAVADCQQVIEGPTLVEKIEPQWVPKDFARTDGKDVGVITLKRGHKRGLFDSGLFWVRMREGQPIGKFAAQPTGGNFPPVRGLFRQVDEDLQVAVDAEDLAVLAKAINATGQPGRSVVMLSISRKPGRHPVVVIGDAGMGFMMPKDTNVSEFLHGYRSRLAGVLEAAAAPGSVVAKPEKGAAPDDALFDNDAGDDL